ncbi:hypothetical protein BG621_06230 [Parasaccharibacter apium]|nr:hypothetical protein BG621_06230 [Parasaccharibacter apium]
MLHSSTHRLRMAARAKSLGLLALLGVMALPAAYAETLPHLSANCFTYSPGQVSKTKQGGLIIKNMQAELTGTQHRITVRSSTVVDHKRTLDAAGLARLNAAVAYAALTAYHRGMTEACANQPLPGVQEVKNALPEMSWQGITLTRPDRASTASTAHVRVLSTSPAIHFLFDANGMTSPQAILLPPSVSGDITFIPSSQPPYHVTVNQLHTALNGSDIDGRGDVLATAGRENLKADVHLSISHIGEMIDQLGKIAPTKITAALLIARIMGEREPNHRTGWHITLEHDTIHVNGVKVPMLF